MGEGIDTGTSVALGVLQGLTEFLPVSSSGHVAIGAMLFGLKDAPLALVVVLHAGTLLATIGALWREIATVIVDTFRGLGRPKAFLQTESGKVVSGVVIASIPTGVIGLGLKDHVEAWSSIPWVVGLCLLGSAACVLSTRRTGGDDVAPSAKQAFLIGLAQGLAVLPGLSRSGSTIAMAMWLGMSGPAAFRFSFLTSLPAIVGAVVLELGDPDALSTLGPGPFIGGVVAFAVGWGALVLLRKLVTQGRFWAFAWYLVPVGLAMIGWGLLGGIDR